MSQPLPAASSRPSQVPAQHGSWLAAQGKLPLAFMGLALAWLAAGAILLLLRPGLLALPHTHPHVVALTHAWLLGFFLTVACGAAYQLAPVALGTTLSSERKGWWHFGMHAIGVPGMVASFWFWNLEQVGHFGLLVAIGAGVYVRNIWVTVRQAGRPGLISTSLRVSAIWLVITLLIGLTLAANRFWYFIPLDPVVLLRAHAHAGIAGFFVTLLQGVTFQLVPMFTLGDVHDWKLPTRGFWMTQIALIGLLPALLLRAAWVETAMGVLLLSGLACSAYALRRVLGTRKKRALDPGVQAFFLGIAVLFVAGIVGLALVWPGSTGGSASGGMSAMFYAVIIVIGGMLPCFSGMMGKIVPFLTWMRAYGPRVGRERVPLASALGVRWAERAGLLLQFLAVVPLACGTWTLEASWLVAGASVLAAGTGLFLFNQLCILRHLFMKSQPAKAAVPAGQAGGGRPVIENTAHGA
ncbi:MAG: hypothetical protein HS122_01745 [Opitutaceae bacterium]|nr:hypothetical protein [Opitutaceae bacterium]